MSDPTQPPPLPLQYLPSTPTGPSRPLALIGAAATTVLAGAAVGAATNAVNGAVSPTYFISVMRWQNVQDVWSAAIAQGILEGVVMGIFFAVIFTLTVGLITKATVTYFAAVRCLGLIVLGSLVCWAAGGLVAMGLATLSPEMYQRAFIGVPSETNAMLRYAWVGGSIWGVQSGGLLCLVVGLVLFGTKWRKQLQPAR